MASIDLDSRATIPLLEGPDSARRAPVRDRAAITDAIQPGELQSRARRAARWGLAAVVIAVIATAGMAVLAIVAMTRAEEWRAMLRGALPADPVVTPRGPASADSPGVAGDLTSAAGGGVAKEAAEVAPGPSTTAPPPAASAPGAPRGRPRGRNPSDPSATF